MACAMAYESEREGTRRMRKLIAVAAVTCLVGGVAGARAQESEADREACKPDVNRLCSDYIPDRDRIIICLNKNYARLARPCHQVIARVRRTGG